jgi:hypothetical protein
VSDKRYSQNALSAAEKAAVLEELLAARPDLRELAESLRRPGHDGRRPGGCRR